jgi:hypothetical protein
MNHNTLITDLIMEAALDSRIPDGVVNLKNHLHVQVIAENMYDAGIDTTTINEFVKKFVDEGKYPDRQAFNKEGWLVTFPSKQYRDAAIKKGTHAIADPTHGQGGMNLYYKKKGKQQRQTQQDTTATEEPNDTAPAQQPVPAPQQKNDVAQQRAPGQVTPEMMGDDGSTAPESEPSEKQPTNTTPEAPADSSLPAAGSEGKPAAPAPAAGLGAKEEPAPASPTTPQLPPYVELSKQFAKQKGWTATPYGEWRNAQGEPSGVVGLTGEIVPVKSVDRDEFKIFATKRTGG